MDKKKEKAQPRIYQVEKQNENKDHKDYGYDFVPNLNEWVNIDEQKEKAKELEDM